MSRSTLYRWRREALPAARAAAVIPAAAAQGKMADLTGPGISDRWGVTATDLGAAVRAPDGKLVAVFGDTFSGNKVGVGDWRSPVVLIGTAFLIEHYRRNPMLHTRWIGSRNLIKFALTGALVRVLTSEQNFGASGLLSATGLVNDQLERGRRVEVPDGHRSPRRSSRRAAVGTSRTTRAWVLYVGRRRAGRSHRRSVAAPIGPSRATGTPRRVTTKVSPASTPRMTSALSLRSSR